MRFAAGGPEGGMSDPWVRPGLALLALLSALAIFLYAATPQSVAEAGGRVGVALAPDAYTPRMARARERLSAALDAVARGDTAAALARYAEGEEEAWSARERAPDPVRAAAATELWAGMALDRAELTLRAGSAPWWRGDDAAMQAEALAAVQRVRAVPTDSATAARAARLEAQVRRRMRPGPLEWVPLP